MQAGNEIDSGSRAVGTPIVMANSSALPEDPSTLNSSGIDVLNSTLPAAVRVNGGQRKLAIPDGINSHAVAAAIRPIAKLVQVETIANPATTVTDVAAVAWRRSGGASPHPLPSLAGYINRRGDTSG